MFSAAMLAIFGLLLNFMIRPYYRNDRLQRMDNLKNAVANIILEDDIEDERKLNIYHQFANADVCAYVLNDNGKVLYELDTLGESCALKSKFETSGITLDINNEPDTAIKLLNNHSLELSYNSSFGNEMLIYGHKIAKNLANYYLFINTPLEPMESVLDFIYSQYLYIGMIIIGISFICSFVLANKLSSPIVKMRKEAAKLANKNYDVSFPSKSFTEINELSNTLEDAALKLSRIEELRKDLIANMSHDIKTPLTMIQAYAEMIKDISGDDPIKRDEHIDVILKEIHYLNTLVSDMQELSKMQAGYIELNKSNFELDQTIEEMVDLLQHLLNDKQLILEKELLPITVYADEIKISQVIYNFLINAIKHSPPNTLIKIRMIDHEDYVRVEIIDHGSGIDEEELPYIWDRYYKIDKGFHRTLESSGLGLAIVRAILEAHHAKYGVESKKNRGSIFYFELGKGYDSE